MFCKSKNTWENSKMFNITSKYFSFFNNKPPASRVTYITRSFLACYFCSYYSSMVYLMLCFGAQLAYWCQIVIFLKPDFYIWLTEKVFDLVLKIHLNLKFRWSNPYKVSQDTVAMGLTMNFKVRYLCTTQFF